jgi:hypothetical protein
MFFGRSENKGRGGGGEFQSGPLFVLFQVIDFFAFFFFSFKVYSGLELSPASHILCDHTLSTPTQPRTAIHTKEEREREREINE